jgi:hypothetical protein
MADAPEGVKKLVLLCARPFQDGSLCILSGLIPFFEPVF